MLPGGFTDSWRNIRPSLMLLSGFFAEEDTQTNINVGKFHAQMTLDTGEIIRVIIYPRSRMSRQQFQHIPLVWHTIPPRRTCLDYISDLKTPKLQLAQGGTYTMDVIATHKIIEIFPISANVETNQRTVILHLLTPYEPPTFYNNVTLRRPDITTPPAIVWHARLACACKEVMMRTQKNVTRMRIQNDSWKTLDTLLSYHAAAVSPERCANPT